MVVIGVSVVVVVLLSGRIRTASTEQQVKVGELASGVERAVGSIRTVRAAGATEREVASVSALATDAYDVGVRIAKVSALVVPVAGIALQVSLLVVLGVGGFRVASGAITIAIARHVHPVPVPADRAARLDVRRDHLGEPGARCARAHPGGARPADRRAGGREDRRRRGDVPDAGGLGIRPGDRVPRRALPLPRERRRRPRGGRERGTGGARAGRTWSDRTVDPALEVDRDVLRGVTFEVPRGSRVALVGPSGAGKSTVLSLIERFYDPTGGAIELDGRDIRSLPREQLRAQFGYVEQDAPTLAGTIADNLRLGSPDATDADCERVLHAVNLSEVLERDPLGIQAPVGEDGVMLSGGERQRLAIARALLAAPPILLLDESTSSLDGVNEQRMREAIDAVAEDRTLIVIAHRLSTVVDSDLIVVLDHGRVVGQGTHSELVASTPLYRDLAKHQLLV